MQDIFYSYREDSAEDFDFLSQKLMKYFASRKHYSFNYCGRISSVSRAPDGGEREVAGSIPGAGPILKVLK